MTRAHNKTGRSKVEKYIKLPFYILHSDAWLVLSCKSRAALIEIMLRYNGYNNGRIGLSVRDLANRLNCSKDSAARALRQLDDIGFIETTKLGVFRLRNRKASEYRLTWLPCHLTHTLPSKPFMRFKRRNENHVSSVRVRVPIANKSLGGSLQADPYLPNPSDVGTAEETHIITMGGGAL